MADGKNKETGKYDYQDRIAKTRNGKRYVAVVGGGLDWHVSWGESLGQDYDGPNDDDIVHYGAHVISDEAKRLFPELKRLPYRG